MTKSTSLRRPAQKHGRGSPGSVTVAAMPPPPPLKVFTRCCAALNSFQAGWLLLITNTALYLNYEFFHYCCHVKDDRIVRHPIASDLEKMFGRAGW